MAGRASGFNPRPTLLPGDAIEREHGHAALTFQSTPDIATGRCQQPKRYRPQWRSFNPRPTLLPGDAFGSTAKARAEMVSIHARHCYRAMPRWLVLHAMEGGVSIHARHCYRAMHGAGAFCEGQAVVSIHARHCCRAMPVNTWA